MTSVFFKLSGVTQYDSGRCVGQENDWTTFDGSAVIEACCDGGK